MTLRPYDQAGDVLREGTVRHGDSRVYDMLAIQTLPYERIESLAIAAAIRLFPGEHLLVLQPFGWHIDGHHIPNAAEHFSRESVCAEHHWELVCDFGPYIAVVKDKAWDQL